MYHEHSFRFQSFFFFSDKHEKIFYYVQLIHTHVATKHESLACILNWTFSCAYNKIFRFGHPRVVWRLQQEKRLSIEPA